MAATTSTRAIAFCLLAAAGCASTPGPRGLIHPLEGAQVSAEYGERRGARRRHRGIDLRAPSGTPVAAAAPGLVAFSGEQRGFGRVVVLDHGGQVTTRYAHLSGFAVRTGERVGPGQTLGFVGRSGNATGPHLHFELRVDGEAVDPRRRISF